MVAILAAVLVAHVPSLFMTTVANPLGPRSQLVAGQTPGLIAGTPTLDGNDGVISQALGHRAALDLIHLKLPWWDPYVGAGTPLAGEMQSAALFPPTLLTLLGNGQLWEHILLELIAGCSTYWLLRRLDLGPGASTVGAIVYALNGTFAWFGHATVNPICFLPLTLLGLERAYAASAVGARGGWTLLALSAALAGYAGFPEMVYIDTLLVAVWFGWRLAGAAPAQRRAFARKCATGAAVAAALCAPLLVCTLDFLPHAVIPLHANNYFASVHVPAASLPQLLLPYIYGPLFAFPNAGWGVVGGYLSTSLFGLAVIGLAGSRHRRLGLVLLGWMSLALARAYGGPPLLDQVLGLLPGMSRVNFARYAFASVELPVAVLAALGLQALAEGSLSRRRVAVSLVAVIAAIALAALGAIPLAGKLGAAYARSHYFAGAVLWGIAVVALIAAAAVVTSTRLRTRLLTMLVLVDVVVLFALPQLSAPRAVHIDLAPVRYLRAHLGRGRFASLGPLAPNYGAYFGLASVNTSDGMVDTQFARFVQTHLDLTVAPTVLLATKGAAAVLLTATSNAQVLSHLAGYRALDVNYFLVAPGRPLPGPFALVERTPSALIYRLSGAATYFSAPGCVVSPRGVDAVAVSCATASTLLRRETYLPGWSASASGRELPVRRAGLFERVALPAGVSTVSFSYAPPHILAAWLAFAGACVWLALARTELGIAALIRRGGSRLRRSAARRPSGGA